MFSCWSIVTRAHGPGRKKSSTSGAARDLQADARYTGVQPLCLHAHGASRTCLVRRSGGDGAAGEKKLGWEPRDLDIDDGLDFPCVPTLPPGSRKATSAAHSKFSRSAALQLGPS